jgi:hypothetical protein
MSADSASGNDRPYFVRSLGYEPGRCISSRPPKEEDRILMKNPGAVSVETGVRIIPARTLQLGDAVGYQTLFGTGTAADLETGGKTARARCIMGIFTALRIFRCASECA